MKIPLTYIFRFACEYKFEMIGEFVFEIIRTPIFTMTYKPLKATISFVKSITLWAINVLAELETVKPYIHVVIGNRVDDFSILDTF
jgi:hypothetical protein